MGLMGGWVWGGGLGMRCERGEGRGERGLVGV